MTQRRSDYDPTDLVKIQYLSHEEDLLNFVDAKLLITFRPESNEFSDFSISVPNDQFAKAFMAVKDNDWCCEENILQRYVATLDTLRITRHRIVKAVMDEEDLKNNILKLQMQDPYGEYYTHDANIAYNLTLISYWGQTPIYILKSAARNLCGGSSSE